MRYVRGMAYWRDNVRTWSGSRLWLLIVQIVVAAGLLAMNVWSVARGDGGAFTMVLAVLFGVLLVFWVATLIGVIMARRDGAAAHDDGPE